MSMGRRIDSFISAFALIAVLVVVVFNLYAKLSSPVTYCGVIAQAQEWYTRYRRYMSQVATVEHVHDGS